MDKIEELEERLAALENSIKGLDLLDKNLERLNVMFDKLIKSTIFYNEETHNEQG